MSTLTISVPDHVLKLLCERAAKLQTTPEQIAAADLTQISEKEKPGDRLRKWVGALDFGVDDAGTNHDQYLGEVLEAKLRGSVGE